MKKKLKHLLSALNGKDVNDTNEDPMGLKNGGKRKVPALSYFQVFKYATKVDICCIIFGILLSIGAGLGLPIEFIYFGKLTDVFLDYQTLVSDEMQRNVTAINASKDKIMDSIFDYLFICIGLGTFLIVMSYSGTVAICYPAIRQMTKIRSLYMQAVLNKDISWYDTNPTSDFSSRITEDLQKIEEAMSDKIGSCAYNLAVFASGTITGLIFGWQLALICFIYFPVSLFAVGLLQWVSNKLVKAEMDAYAQAATIAEEVFGAIRTVMAFEGQEKERTRYAGALKVARANNVRKACFTALNNALMWTFVFLSYSLSFYYGIKLIIDERNDPEPIYTPGNVITVFINILMSSWSFGQCAPFFQIFAIGKVAATTIYKVIEEPPTINLAKRAGVQLPELEGDISFRNVHFQYPSRSDVKILRGLNISIKKGETVALVGSSGCGKSTCIQLIQRFYDTAGGQVLIDDIDIKHYDLTWLRNQIGVVGQEPVLFATTIAENIRNGYRDATPKEIEVAAIKANAHTFIEKLPNGYETTVGERGAQLSGGQKQRIAIARALIRNPRILLLDEATSALDTYSESLVQEALDNASKECTTVIVAHRLTTIRGADRIIVLQEGVVVEDGNHSSLMELRGVYYNLVTAQVAEVDETELDQAGQDSQDEPNAMAEKRKSNEMNKSINDTNEETLQQIRTMRILLEVLKMNRPEWWMIFLGTFAAIVQGASMPAYAIIFGDVVKVLSETDVDVLRAEGNRYSLYFLLIGIVCGISSFIQSYMLIISGEQLTLRIRSKVFQAMLKQEIGWFDKPENSVGALCTALSSDAAGMQGASGQPIGTTVNSMASLGFAIIVAFTMDWRVTLVGLCFVPLIFLSIYCEAQINAAGGPTKPVEHSANYAIEAIGSIRTVASLGIEDLFHAKYMDLLQPYFSRQKRSTHIRGIVLGNARAAMFFCYGAITYYGGTLVVKGEMNFSIIYKVSEALVSGAWAVGTAVAFTPNFQKGIQSAGKLLQMIARVPAIQSGDYRSDTPMPLPNISYRNVSFAYPNRVNVNVLCGLNLDILHGKTVALVGPSGCGKSTIIQLLERFYDPKNGSVQLAQKNLPEMTLPYLRSHLGIVSQEPNLFDRTIMENIAYGDNMRKVTADEIFSAARKANIHTFIQGLPLGYETRLGEKGTQLSGGQKQRIAIARALIRNPSILLLDEATSALDTESEKVVQQALDQAKAGRTCITIAHRLLTIQDADVICVIKKGVVEEMGSHSQLLEKRGLYHQLYNLQMGHS